MPGVIFRHLFGETARTWLTITAVLVFLTLGIGLSKFIGDAAAGEVPVDTVATLAALSVVSNLEIVMPISMLLAILLVVGRLCQDNEMTALMAGGAGLAVIYRPFIALAVMVALFAGTMSIIVAPYAQREINRLGAQTAANAVQAITPGRFASFDDGRISFYAESRDDRGRLHHVFVRVLKEHKGQDRQIIVTAATARQSVNPQHAVTLVLTNGWRYEGIPGQADYRIIHFDEHGVRLSPARMIKENDYDAKSTLTLMRSDDKHAIYKWQTRISVPLSILILALIALPIGRAPPRAGRYGRIIVGILFFVVYLNLVRLSGQAMENGWLPVIIGEWWVHVVVLAVAIVLIARDNGWPRRRARRSRGGGAA